MVLFPFPPAAGAKAANMSPRQLTGAMLSPWCPRDPDPLQASANQFRVEFAPF